ncbi:MAG: hypothetical protein PHG85_01985 [Candidatus Altiarchaeota archaeon]|nr:hypothetical protein [Candidatus Altiarchaeota archaeon]
MIKHRQLPDAADGLSRGEQSQLKSIGELIAKGVEREVIAEKVGVSGPAFDGLLKKAGEGSFWDYEKKVTADVVRESIKAGKTAKQAAGKMGLTLGAVLKRVGSVAVIKAEVARDVASEMLAAGKSEAEVLRKLGIKTPSTLVGRLAAAGTTLDELYEQAGVQRPGSSVVGLEDKALKEVAMAVERHIRTMRASIPRGAEKAWLERGSPDSAGYYRDVFRQLVEGVTPAVADSEYYAARRVVLPEVKQQLRKDAGVILGLLKAPAVSQQEIDVFRLVAVEDLTEKKAGEALEFSEARASQVKSSLIRKIPSLSRFLTLPKTSREVREGRERAREAKVSLKQQQGPEVDAYLKANAPKHLSGLIRSRAMKSSAPMALAAGIVTAVEDAMGGMNAAGLPGQYQSIAVKAVIKYVRFTEDAVKAVRDLSSIAKAADEAMDSLGVHIPKSQRLAVYQQVALPGYVDKPGDVLVRVREIWDRKAGIEEEMENIHAPSECRNKITSTLMTTKETPEVMLSKARVYAASYLEVKRQILDDGHPEVVLGYVGVPAITYRNPSEGWRVELAGALRRESKHVRKGRYAEKTGLDDSRFLELLHKSRSGVEDARRELLDRFGFLAIRSGRSEQWAKENSSAIEALVLRLPERHFAERPLAQFTTYTSYIVRLCDMRRARTELIEQKGG